VELSCEHVGSGMPGLDAKEPCRGDGARALRKLRDHQWAPGREQEHNRLAEIENSFGERRLSPGQAGACPACGFTAHMSRLPSTENDKAGLAAAFPRLSNLRNIRAFDRDSRRIVYPCLRECCRKALAEGDDASGIPGHRPWPKHLRGCIGERPN